MRAKPNREGSKLLSKFSSELESKLGQLNFTWDVQRRVFVRSFGVETEGLLFATPETSGVSVRIIPVVAFDNTLLRAQANADRDAPHENIPRVAHAYLATLAGRFYQEWVCTSTRDVTSTVDELIGVLSDFGLPFMSRWDSLERVVNLLEISVSGNEPQHVIVNYARDKLRLARAVLKSRKEGRSFH